MEIMRFKNKVEIDFVKNYFNFGISFEKIIRDDWNYKADLSIVFLFIHIIIFKVWK